MKLLVDGGLRLGPRQRAEAFRVIANRLLLGLGCDPALAPAVPVRWEGVHPPGVEEPKAGRPR